MTDKSSNHGAAQRVTVPERICLLLAAPRHYRPLVDVAVGYLCGTWFALNYPTAIATGLAVCAALAIAVLVATLVSGHSMLLSRLLAVLCVAALACGIGALHRAHRQERSGGLLEAGKRVVMRGVVAGDPVCRKLNEGRRCVWKFALRVSAARIDDSGWQEVRGDIPVNWYGWIDADGPLYGDAWEINGTVKEYGVHRPVRVVEVDARDAVVIGENRGHWFTAMCYRLRKAAARLLSIGSEDKPQHRAMLLAMLLGYRDQLDAGSRDLFKLTGTLHVFAISGLHVGILAGVMTQLLRYCRVRRGGWIFFLAPCLVVYAVSTGARASAVRACIMAIIYFLAPTLGRKADLPSGLALAAVIILAWDPLQLQDIGFIFSFTVVTGLLALYPCLSRLSERFWRRDPFIVGQGTVLQRSSRAVRHYIVSLAALSLAAWLSSAPLTAYFFGRFTAVALLGNIVVIPLAFVTVLCGCCALVLGACLELFALIFNRLGLVSIDLLIHTLHVMAAIPYGSIQTGKPPLWSVWISYAALAGLALWLRHFAGIGRAGIPDEQHRNTGAHQSVKNCRQ